MPLYEYHCLDCAETFQKRLSFAQADEVASCPDCESDRTRKVLGGFMVLNGSSSMKQSSSLDRQTSSAGGCCGGHCGCH